MGPWEWGAIGLVLAALIFVFFVERWDKKNQKQFDARMELFRAQAIDRIQRQRERDRRRDG